MLNQPKPASADNPKGRPARAIVLFVAGLVCGLLFLGVAGLRTAVWGTPECGSFDAPAAARYDWGTETRQFDVNELWLRRALLAGQPFESISVSVPGKGNLVFTDRDAGIVVSYAETPRGRF